MVVMLPNFRMFSFEMLGRFRTFLMNCVWLFSHIPIALYVAEMVAVCPYSKSGRMKILYRRIIVEVEGPLCWLKILCSLCTLDCALATVMFICFKNVRLWSNVTPRNLACLVVGIGFLCIRSDVFLGVFVYSSSNDKLGCFIFV